MIAVVTYDIPDNKRRHQLHRLLEGYGVAVQRSVFECDLSPNRIAALMGRMDRLIEPDADSLALYALCERCHAAILRRGAGPTGEQPPLLVL